MEEQTISVPETYTRRKLNALYREANLKDRVSRTLRKYFNAMANLYGMIPLWKAWEIIKEQYPTLVTEEEFLAYCDIARHECEQYLILGEDELVEGASETPLLMREIIDKSLLEDEEDDSFIKIRRLQSDKEYLVPDKKTLLSYEDPKMIRDEASSEKLLSFLKASSLGEEKAEEAFEKLLWISRHMTGETAELFMKLSYCDIRFETEEFAAFAPLFQQFLLNTPMQMNAGATPLTVQVIETVQDAPITLGQDIQRKLELGEITPEDVRAQIHQLNLSERDTNTLLTELAAIELLMGKEPVKVGRNDPCPCGSGKKFKKCCGSPRKHLKN